MTTRPQFWPKPITLPDHSLFIVMRDFGRHGLESVSEPDMTRDSLIADIATGQIEQPIVYIIECNPREGWSRDITADIAEAVEAVRHQRAAE